MRLNREDLWIIAVGVATLLFVSPVLALPFPGLLISIGGSMYPTLKPGDVLVVLPATHIKIGDIVITNHYGTLIGHRVIAVNNTYVITKGDANPRPDKPTPRGMVKGKVVSVLPPLVMLLLGIALAAAAIPAKPGAQLLVSLFILAIIIHGVIASTADKFPQVMVTPQPLTKLVKIDGKLFVAMIKYPIKEYSCTGDCISRDGYILVPIGTNVTIIPDSSVRIKMWTVIK